MSRDLDNARIWRRENKRKLREVERRVPLHRRLGIETIVVRVAVTDARANNRYMLITLPRV